MIVEKKINSGLYVANIKPENCTPAAIQQVTVDLNICTHDGLRADNFVIARTPAKIFYLSDPPSKDAQIKGVFVPGDPGYVEGLWAAVSEVKEELRRVFGLFADGKMIDLAWLNEIHWRTTRKETFVMSGDDEWEPVFIPFDIGGTKAFYYNVLRKAVVEVFLLKKGREFQRIRRCIECGDFFYANDIRKVFCGVPCKNRFHYKKNHSDQGG